MGRLQTEELLFDWNKIISNEIKDQKLIGCALVYFDGTEISENFFGYSSSLKSYPITTKTQFEIASLTKIFTGLICAKLISSNKISFNTKLGDFNWEIASKEVSNITIMELLTHSSGLPRVPKNIKPNDPLNPYHDYTEDQMRDALNRISIDSKEYCYSNFGYAVLGKILSIAGEESLEMQFKKLLHELELFDTQIFNGENIENLSESYNENLKRVPHWNFANFIASGGITSTAHDMSILCQQLLLPQKSQLAKTISLSLKEILPNKNFSMAMGWHIYQNSKIYSHDGATYGHYAKVRLIPSENKFLICLSNTYNDLERIEILP